MGPHISARQGRKHTRLVNLFVVQTYVFLILPPVVQVYVRKNNEVVGVSFGLAQLERKYFRIVYFSLLDASHKILAASNN